jgi:hypothetical protein
MSSSRAIGDARHPLARAMEARDAGALTGLLAATAVLHSPAIGMRRFEGREAVMRLLGVLIDRYEAWACYEQLAAGTGDVVLLVRARIRGYELEESILVRHDRHGQISELRVFGRPLSGVAALAATAGQGIAAARGKARAVAVWLGTVALPPLLHAGDRVLSPLALSDQWWPGWSRSVRLDESIEIEAPLESVFAVVSDPLKDRGWCPRVIWCEQRAGSGPGVGARYEAFHNPTLRRRHIRSIELQEFEAPTRMVSCQEDELASFTISYLLEPISRGTRLTQRDEIHWQIPRIALPLATLIVRRHMREQLRDLRSLVSLRPRRRAVEALARP